ncbi:AP-3 complex subunit mu-1-like [Tamandua tetradactyla]|uniref:AP-3 complex subunit mu-1-like n=1 Tax=Tamandua tetradactyla TaxID=48850 RepID=UPI004053CDD2
MTLVLINCPGDVFLEKHWKSMVSQSVCDYFFEAQEKAVNVENVPPVMPTPHHYLIGVYWAKLFFISVLQTEVPSLSVIEFLHRIADTFQDCSGSSNVGVILLAGQPPNIPWHRVGVKYTHNEAYFDVIEEIEAIIDKEGSTVLAEIQGVIDACIKLSGMPDLSLSFIVVGALHAPGNTWEARDWAPAGPAPSLWLLLAEAASLVLEPWSSLP